MKIKEFKKLLDKFDEDLELQFTDWNIFKSEVLRLREMFYAPDNEGSRGLPNENISHDQDDEFCQRVVVAELDW